MSQSFDTHHYKDRSSKNTWKLCQLARLPKFLDSSSKNLENTYSSLRFLLPMTYCRFLCLFIITLLSQDIQVPTSYSIHFRKIIFWQHLGDRCCLILPTKILHMKSPYETNTKQINFIYMNFHLWKAELIGLFTTL